MGVVESSVVSIDTSPEKEHRASSSARGGPRRPSSGPPHYTPSSKHNNTNSSRTILTSTKASQRTEKYQITTTTSSSGTKKLLETSPTPPKKKNNNNEPIYFPLPSPLVLRKKREASLNGGRNNMEDFFEGMPVEMLFYILQFLDIHELLRLSLVCKYFKEVIEQPESDTVLWKNVHDTTFGGGGRKTLYYRVDLRKGSGRPWEDDTHTLYWRKVCIDETRQLLWRSKNRNEKIRYVFFYFIIALLFYYCIVLCIVSYCFVLHCFVLFCIVLGFCFLNFLAFLYLMFHC